MLATGTHPELSDENGSARNNTDRKLCLTFWARRTPTVKLH